MPLETFGNCVEEVMNYGFMDGPQINRKRVENWINEAQQQIAEQVEAPEWQAKEVIAITKGTYRYALPSKFLRMESVYFPALQVRLRPVDQQSFDRNSPIVEGPPLIYTIREEEIWLYPTPISTEKAVELPPSSSEGLEMRYYKAPEFMTTEAAIPTLNKRFLFLLVDYALWRAFKGEDDQEMGQAHLNAYKEGLDHYASVQQRRDTDRPRQLDGTWGSGTFGQGGWY